MLSTSIHNTKNIYFLLILITALLACTANSDTLVGKYALAVKGMKNTSSGELEIVGEPGDYFGKITFHSSRKRVYEVGLAYTGRDSLYFILPGKGGFLFLKKENAQWTGAFKYFGVQAGIEAKKIGRPSPELAALVELKPLGEGVISSDQEESFPSYDPDNQILYFTRGQKIYSSKRNGAAWEAPTLLAFSQEANDSAPYVFADGRSLLFTSDRPIAEGEANKKNLWQVDRVNNAWSMPSPLPYPINIDTLGDYHGAALENGHYYFVSYNRAGGFGRSDLYLAVKNAAGDYEVTNLGARINSEKSEADVYIDPDERYLLFASTGREDSFGADDIYISFRQGEGWSVPQNIGPKVNSFAYEYGAWVDERNGYLYFNSFRRGTSDIYRVKLGELDVFKP